MKQRSTTPVSKGIVTKSALVAAAVVVATSSSFCIIGSNNAYADHWDDQISSLHAQMEQYQQQANKLNALANSLQAELDKITEQKNNILAQIEISQKQHDVLQSKIEDTNKKIADNKSALGQIIADMYVDVSISPLEMLASSKNIGDYMDQQEYRSSVQDNLSAKIEEISKLKKKLESDKKEVELVLSRQNSQKAALAAKEADQARIVEKTRGEEAAYQALVSDAKAQAERAHAEQAAYIASLRSSSGGSGYISGIVGSIYVIAGTYTGEMGVSGGYPYGGAQDSYADPWGLFNRECVSYAAWRIENGYGKKVNHFMGHGHAYQWEYSAKARTVSDPQPGDAVIAPIGYGMPYGHLMVVESVSGDTIYVSQYNFDGTGQYSRMAISKSKSSVIFKRF